MKNEKQTSNVNFNVQSTYFDVFCLNFSIETKIKTLFLISYFNLSKKTKWHFGYTDSSGPESLFPYETTNYIQRMHTTSPETIGIY